MPRSKIRLYALKYYILKDIILRTKNQEKKCKQRMKILQRIRLLGGFKLNKKIKQALSPAEPGKRA